MQGSISLLSQIYQDDNDKVSLGKLDLFANMAKMFGNQSILMDEILQAQSSLIA